MKRFDAIRRLFWGACLMPLLVLGQGKSSEARLQEIDAYAAKAGQDWRVPGFAVAIIKDDAVVFAKGYGVRELGKTEPVNEHTLFAIASNSKAFTAAALSILVDEGKIKWDDPATKYLPGFQLYDPYVTGEIAVRDLLCHRSGLATFGGDLLWYMTTYSREEILHRMRYLKPVTSFRTAYGYQNLMFLAAGQILPAVTGKSWDEYIKEKFFVPLGMSRSNTSVAAFKQGDNVATPHNEVEGQIHVIHYVNVDNLAPGGGINSSVADMSQWLRLQLGRGTYQGKEIFSKTRSREMWTAHTSLPISEQSEKLNPTTHFQAYGLGWFMMDYHGRKVLNHGGGLDGMTSQTGMIPEANLGVVVLTNSETPLSSIIMRKVFDVFLEVPPRDWSAETRERVLKSKEEQRVAAQKIEQERVEETKPSLLPSGYAGTFSGELYGDATVTVESGKLVLRLMPAPDFVGDLEHWHYDTFRLKWRGSVVYPFPKGFVTFTLNAAGDVDEMKIDVPNPDFDFKELKFKYTPEQVGTNGR
ncbi:MAG: serine hydrolase [bacterium]